MKLKSAFLEISYAFFFLIFALHMHFVNINVLDLSRSLHCTAALGICSNSWFAIRLCYAHKYICVPSVWLPIAHMGLSECVPVLRVKLSSLSS